VQPNRSIDADMPLTRGNLEHARAPCQRHVGGEPTESDVDQGHEALASQVRRTSPSIRKAVIVFATDTRRRTHTQISSWHRS